MSVLVLSEILGVFVNTLTAEDKYSYQRQLSKKQFLKELFFAAYLKSTSNFEHLEKER